jgi:WbqC-like protein family
MVADRVGTMKLGIMQPYVFPYIGYFQLVHAVDRFVIYDDVNFIKQGWINRNRILIAGQPRYFTVPLANASSYTSIREIQVCRHDWRSKLLKSVEHAYKRSPFFSETFPLIESVLLEEESFISKLAFNSILKIAAHLDISTEFVTTSTHYNNAHLKAQERVLDICRMESASHYINPIGGIGLYSKQAFLERGIDLQFIKPKQLKYPQFKNDFVPWLSIIDILMFNGQERTCSFLDEYERV